jgi:hypothetical protein
MSEPRDEITTMDLSEPSVWSEPSNPSEKTFFRDL